MSPESIEKMRETKRQFVWQADNLIYSESLIFHSAYDIKRVGFDFATVTKVANGLRKQHKGYSWKKIAKTEI